MKRTLLAIGTAAVLGLAALPTSASAQHWGGHWGGPHFGWGGGWGGPRIAFGFGAAPYAYDYDYGYGVCRWHRVWTPYGWRLRRWC